MPDSRKLFTIFLSLLLLCSSIEAQTTKVLNIPNIRGTEWVGKDFGVEGYVTTYRFENDGTLAYAYQGDSYRNGTWKQEGDKVYFETNNKYSECELTLKDYEMSGRCWNVAKDKWETSLYKYTKPE